MNKTFFLLFLSSVFLFANTDNKEQQELMLNQTIIDLQEKSNLDTFRQMREHKDFIENEFLNLNGIKVSNSVEIKKSTDTIQISMHPEFPRTILFDNAKITYTSAYPQNAIDVFIDEDNLNSLEIKINNSFKKGVVVVKYLDNNNRRRVQNIFIESFNSKIDSQIFLTTEIKSINKVSEIDILKAYQKLNGKTPINGSSIVINDLAYRFIEDRINGNITIANKKFRIEQNFNK